MKDLLLDFLIGSSIFITIFPKIYLHSNDPFLNKVLIFLPILYGFTYVVLKYILTKYIENKQLLFICIGALAGLFYSIIGRFILGIPRNILNIKKSEEWKVHPTAMILYAVLYGIIIYNLDEILK